MRKISLMKPKLEKHHFKACFLLRCLAFQCGQFCPGNEEVKSIYIFPNKIKVLQTKNCILLVIRQHNFVLSLAIISVYLTYLGTIFKFIPIMNIERA